MNCGLFKSWIEMPVRIRMRNHGTGAGMPLASILNEVSGISCEFSGVFAEGIVVSNEEK